MLSSDRSSLGVLHVGRDEDVQHIDLLQLGFVMDTPLLLLNVFLKLHVEEEEKTNKWTNPLLRKNLNASRPVVASMAWL